jgi:hypothetical protein
VSGFVVIVFSHDSKILTPGSRRALSWRARVRLRTHTVALVLPQGDQGMGMPGFQGFRLHLLAIQLVQLVGEQIENPRAVAWTEKLPSRFPLQSVINW